MFRAVGVWGAGIALASMVAIPVIFSAGRAYEGDLLPVVGRLQIDRIERSPGGSLIWVRFNKLRDCEFVGLAWYHGERDGVFDRARIEFRQSGDDSAATRVTGEQRAGPWFVSIPPDEIETNSFAYLRHRCHPLWETQTPFYP